MHKRRLEENATVSGTLSFGINLALEATSNILQSGKNEYENSRTFMNLLFKMKIEAVSASQIAKSPVDLQKDTETGRLKRHMHPLLTPPTENAY